MINDHAVNTIFAENVSKAGVKGQKIKLFFHFVSHLQIGFAEPIFSRLGPFKICYAM